MQRRDLLLGATFAAASFSPASARTLLDDEMFPFGGFDEIVARAEQLARLPYAMGQPALPASLRSLRYDAYRSIRFDRAQALWAAEDLPFRCEPFHRGFLFERRVALHEVSGNAVRRLRFDTSQFSYGEGIVPPTEELGFAGARLLYRLNQPDRFDELAVFLGASYFRALGRGHAYGISARGLAIRTAHPGGEEFPWFRAIWLERPQPDATSLVVMALLDSESVAGAYRFTIRPGETTVIEVEARLFARRAIVWAGVAPLTSMYWHGPLERRQADDFRPAVHDSDGLLISAGNGETIWRPLANPRTLQLSAFAGEAPLGFGLMQRKRRFADYEDTEAAYHRRPGLWVEPLQGFGDGQVVLVEIPTSGEIHDNIAAMWRPRAQPPAGAEWVQHYRLHWCSEAPIRADSGLARFTSARSGVGSAPGQRRFVLDAEGAGLDASAAEEFDADLWASAGSLLNRTIEHNRERGGLRLAFELRPGGAPLVELGARIKGASGPLSETWLYRWTE